ncbi:MAG: hypothetical protein ABSB60_10950 [Terracidiphilus sp.]|jgi:hypothetical protein
MSQSVKPPNSQKDSVMAPVEPVSVKPPNTRDQPGLTPAGQVVSVKPPNNS